MTTWFMSFACWVPKSIFSLSLSLLSLSLLSLSLPLLSLSLWENVIDCFSTAPMVTRKRLTPTLYIHCPSTRSSRSFYNVPIRYLETILPVIRTKIVRISRKYIHEILSRRTQTSFAIPIRLATNTLKNTGLKSYFDIYISYSLSRIWHTSNCENWLKKVPSSIHAKTNGQFDENHINP